MSPMIPGYLTSEVRAMSLTGGFASPHPRFKQEKEKVEQVLSALQEFYEDEKRRQAPQKYVVVVDRHQKDLHEGRHR